MSLITKPLKKIRTIGSNSRPKIHIRQYLVYEAGTEVELTISGEHILYCKNHLSLDEPYTLKKVNIPEGTGGYVISTIIPTSEMMENFGFGKPNHITFVPVLLDIWTQGLSVWISEQNIKPVLKDGEKLFIKKIFGTPVEIVTKKPNVFVYLYLRLLHGTSYEEISL